MAEVTLTAPDISCEHCVSAIKKAVAAVPGVRAVDGDPETKQVRVVYDEAQASLDAIERAMAEEGYPVSGRA
ncbi:MAG TPA: heavy-metal-associated domain-containing protein [Dehalococcoidia bacterium]